MPAIVTYRPEPAPTVLEAVGSILSKLEQVVVELWPAWLPGGQELTRSGGAGIAAARSLALEMAAATEHFGPFVAELAERCVSGADNGASVRFPAELRASELAALIAEAFHRSQTALLVYPPLSLLPLGAESLVDACDWLAQHGRLSVWLTGALPAIFDRFKAIHVTIEDDRPPVHCQNAIIVDAPQDAFTIQYPALAGKPHPGSKAEQALEAALAGCEWAVGRVWNQTFQPHTLANPVRVDLLWVEERCVVEVDGPDHCSALKFEADRRRDVHLQLEGFAVLRFTNDQILKDVSVVRSQIERFIQSRRTRRLNGERRAG